MTKDKWLDLKDKVKERFDVEKEETNAFEDAPNSVCETLFFTSPFGKIKLEWISKPKVLNEKTVYSNRIGSNVKVEKIYSENERSEYIKAYKFDIDEWEEINSDSFDNI